LHILHGRVSANFTPDKQKKAQSGLGFGLG